MRMIKKGSTEAIRKIMVDLGFISELRAYASDYDDLAPILHSQVAPEIAYYLIENPITDIDSFRSYLLSVLLCNSTNEQKKAAKEVLVKIGLGSSKA